MIEYKVEVYADGTKVWYLNSRLHREDGPAIEYADGAKVWYLHNEKLTEDEFINITQPKEITISEIENELGHTVKVIAD